VYKLSTTNFPTNSVDTSRTDSSFTNDNGYCNLNLSGDIKATGSANELEYDKVGYSGGTEIFQIITWYSDTDITIDLEYDAGLTFTSVQYYYANYHGVFKIYAGLRSGHALNAQKPYRLLTTVKAVPDSSNNITLNVSEILKSDIDILGEGTGNNDITQFTEFYIEYAESYDYSPDGYTLQTYTSSYTSDSSNYAIAVNAKLPFANGYGGSMDFYYNSGNLGPNQFLIDLIPQFNISNDIFPVLFEVYPFKLYFLNKASTQTLTLEQYDQSDTLIQSDTFTYTDDEGVYCTDDLNLSLIDDTKYFKAIVESAEIFIIVNRQCTNHEIYLRWRNSLGGFDHWLFTAEKDYSIDIENVRQSEEDIFINFPNSYNSNAQRIKYDTQRTARESILVRSQNLTSEQLYSIKYIKTSPLVLLNNRNVLVDSSSFLVYSESDKLYSISFNIQMTDTIPSQSL